MPHLGKIIIIGRAIGAFFPTVKIISENFQPNLCQPPTAESGSDWARQD